MKLEADYVIVGAGSAGCALAYRLSEDSKNSVIVIEYGGSDAGPFIQMPGALSFPMNMKRYDWGFHSAPEPHLNNRVMHVARGKVVGGSSSINGMVFVRGHASDFDHWRDSGAEGWGYSDVLPYFKRMETWHGPRPSEYRGTNGPLHVTRGSRDNPLFLAFQEAGRQAGYHVTDDYNGQRQEGVGPMEMTTHGGERWSAAKGYLRPALKRDNVTLVRGYARKIMIKDGRAVGVELVRNRLVEPILARKEVIIAASAINSPKLLMVSGIGPAEQLREHGIDVVADRAGVGQNLQDHMEVFFQMKSKLPITLYRYWNLLGKAWVGLRWLLTRTGPGASNQFETAGFIRSRAGVEYPDIQYHFLPIAVSYTGQAAAEGHGFQAHVGTNRSSSRGAVTLASGNPMDPPKIQFNYMSDPQDWQDFRDAIRLTREIFAQPAFDKYADGEIQPGVSVHSDKDLDDFIRDHAESAYHPCGTCKMGSADDPMAVVDPQCRVIGVDGLRVADSSIFPRITNGNLNAPSIMVGEKAADHILGQGMLDPENLPAWTDPDWQSAQR